MRQLYQRWIHDWETRLTMRDSNRVVRPFEWGLNWARHWPLVNGNFPTGDGGAERFFRDLNSRIIAHSDDFFSYKTPKDFRLERRKVERFATGSDKHEQNLRVPNQTAEFLRFTSPVHTPYAENDVVNARWFPARGRRAVIVLPQWNSDALSHNSLCRLFNMMGIAALRFSMPYHDIRMPGELERADYAVSANVGRTIVGSPDSESIPAVDRQWIAFTDAKTAFLTYNHQALNKVVQKSTDGGLTYGTDVQVAARTAVDELPNKLNSSGGIILIDRLGKIGYARNTTHMPVCSIKFGAPIIVDS